MVKKAVRVGQSGVLEIVRNEKFDCSLILFLVRELISSKFSVRQIIPMDDVADSRGREAMLPDHSGISGSIACCNVNMTSIDSGVETGNDSNDSSIVQQEGHQQQQVVASQVISNGVATVDTNSI